MCLAALGVVFGDIGTSPLYAFVASCKKMPGAVAAHCEAAVRESAVLGLLSLIIWSLLIIISVKYIMFVMRADKNGEGGIWRCSMLVSLKGKRAGELALEW